MSHDAFPIDPDLGSSSSYPFSAETNPTESRLEVILEANSWMIPEVIVGVTDRILTMNASFRAKRSKLVRLANEVNRALQPQTACQNGCSYCCSMVTYIYRYEALQLAEVSGRHCVDLPFRPHQTVIATGEALVGKVCPFLVARRCSVYENRPMICRLHHSLNEDPEDCDLSVPLSAKKMVAMYDPDFVEVPYHQLVRSHYPKEPWGAITEFFPTESGLTVS